jgi:hypothetical protein
MHLRVVPGGFLGGCGEKLDPDHGGSLALLKQLSTDRTRAAAEVQHHMWASPDEPHDGRTLAVVIRIVV